MPARTPQNEDLDRFLKTLDRPSVVGEVVAAGGGEPAHVALWLDTYLNECYVALELVQPHLVPSARILEIGSGIGAFTIFLREHGYDVTAIEPVGEAFDFIGLAGRALAAQLGAAAVALDVTVESLAADVHGRFDVAFSVNVLEHLESAIGGLDAINSVMAPGGVQVHTCPNYAVPYEPHVGMPLVPVRPAATARWWARDVADTPIWKSLNWVTARQVRRWAKTRGRSVELRPRVMVAALERLARDPMFAIRHQSPLVRIASSRPVRAAVGWLPPTLSTPMVFTVR